jgi:hypothetical protein
MSMAETQKYLLGVVLTRAIEGLVGDESPETLSHWRWLVNLLEDNAQSDPKTDGANIRSHLIDPRMPF